MATRIGQLKAFDPDEESIAAYLERFDLYVSINDVTEDKRAPTLLLVVGWMHYTLIRDLVSPDRPEAKPLATLKEILLKHYDPEPIVIAERFHFYQRVQKPDESISDYLASLRKLASRCKFGDFLSEALRDRLVCGLHSESTQKALLAKDSLTLEKALETALGMEAAAKRTKEMKGMHERHPGSPVLRVDKTVPGHGATPCSRCGRGNHLNSECRFKDAKCHRCGKVGHIAPVCRSKPGMGQAKHTRWLAAAEHDQDPDSQSNESLFVLKDKLSNPYLELMGNPSPWRWILGLVFLLLLSPC